MERIIKTAHYEATLHPDRKTLFIIIPVDEDLTDAAPGNEPTQRLPERDANGLVNYYEEADVKTDRQWREKLGNYLYEFVIKQDMDKRGITDPRPDKVILANLPLHYSVWAHKKGDPHDPRIDHYLYGSQFVNVFRSPMEFCLHLKWILRGKAMKNGWPNCRCCWCDGTRPQGEISQELGTYRPHRRDRKDKNDSKKDGGPKKPRTSTVATIPFKDYTKLNTASS